MSTCNCEKQDRYANCCKLKREREENERLAASNRGMSGEREKLREELADATATAKEALGALAGKPGKLLRNIPAEELCEALLWASGSMDFAIGPPRGRMRDGFEERVLPVLRKYAEHYARRENP